MPYNQGGVIRLEAGRISDSDMQLQGTDRS